MERFVPEVGCQLPSLTGRRIPWSDRRSVLWFQTCIRSIVFEAARSFSLGRAVSAFRRSGACPLSAGRDRRIVIQHRSNSPIIIAIETASQGEAVLQRVAEDQLAPSADYRPRLVAVVAIECCAV